VPEGWEATTLGEVAEVVGGGTPPSKVEDYFDGDVPWLAPKDLSSWTGRWIEHGARNLSAEGLKKSSAKLLPRGAVLVSSRAPIGYVALAANPISTNQGFRSLVLKDGYDPLFFYYLMTTMKHAMEGVAGGSTFKEISGSSIKQLKVSIPPLPEQLRIADLMSAVDDQLAAYKAQVEAGSRRRSALLSELLKPQAGWKETTLGEAANFINGYAFKPADLDGEGLPVIRIKEMLNPKVKPDRSSVAVPPDRLLRDGDLIFSWSGTLATEIWQRGEASLNQHLFRVVEKPGIDKRWLRFSLDSSIGELKAKSHGTTMKHITKADLLTHTVHLPPLSEQLRLADLMSAVDDELDALRDAREETKTLRTTLLQDLLSGKHRIPESYDRLLKKQAAPNGAEAAQGQESDQAAA
jgi:type I restriction enzyme S subunit